MKVVVDSNVLFTSFWKDAVFNKISLRLDLALYSPEFALEEINKYTYEIIKKAKITKEEFKKIKEELVLRVVFIPIKEYVAYLKQAQQAISDLPKEAITSLLNDLDFLALSLKLECPLWSNDSLLKKQKKIEVITTKEIISLLS